MKNRLMKNGFHLVVEEGYTRYALFINHQEVDIEKTYGIIPELITDDLRAWVNASLEKCQTEEYIHKITYIICNSYFKNYENIECKGIGCF